MPRAKTSTVRFIDLFCGIGGFRIAAEHVLRARGKEPQCVFSSDIDTDAQTAYAANFGERPTGDITKVNERSIPDHDILFGGFPCQSFSICGDRRGFDDIRGTLFFDVARILAAKRPRAFVLENVKQLSTHDGGTTMRVIHETLSGLGYHAEHRVLNAINYGVPQKRERTFIVGFREPLCFRWPIGKMPMTPLEDILLPDEEVPPYYWASETIRAKRLEKFEGELSAGRTIWHENKCGHISAYPYSCAMRAGASYNYLLVDGKRRLTEREMLRIQGFPDDYQIACGYSATRKQCGNSVAVPCVAAVLSSVFNALKQRRPPPAVLAPLQPALELEEAKSLYAVGAQA